MDDNRPFNFHISKFKPYARKTNSINMNGSKNAAMSWRVPRMLKLSRLCCTVSSSFSTLLITSSLKSVNVGIHSFCYIFHPYCNKCYDFV